jgi:hypothetical protein
VAPGASLVDDAAVGVQDTEMLELLEHGQKNNFVAALSYN